MAARADVLYAKIRAVHVHLEVGYDVKFDFSQSAEVVDDGVEKDTNLIRTHFSIVLDLAGSRKNSGDNTCIINY